LKATMSWQTRMIRNPARTRFEFMSPTLPLPCPSLKFDGFAKSPFSGRGDSLQGHPFWVAAIPFATAEIIQEWKANIERYRASIRKFVRQSQRMRVERCTARTADFGFMRVTHIFLKALDLSLRYGYKNSMRNDHICGDLNYSWDAYRTT
jgi:hypothetical protein